MQINLAMFAVTLIIASAALNPFVAAKENLVVYPVESPPECKYNITFETISMINDPECSNMDVFVFTVSHPRDLNSDYIDTYMDITIRESGRRLDHGGITDNVKDAIQERGGGWRNRVENCSIDGNEGIFSLGKTQNRDGNPVCAAQYAERLSSEPYKEKQVLIVIQHVSEDQARSLLASLKVRSRDL
jgi:hypothetical protein